MKRERTLKKAATLLPCVCFGLMLWVAMPTTTGAQETEDDPAPSSAIETTEKNESADDSDGEKSPKDDRLAVPDKAALTEAMTLVKDLFQEDFKAARTAAKKSELAKKILKSGIDTNDDTAGRYVLLRLARDIATKAIDLETAMQAIDELGKSFKVETLDMQAKVIKQLADKVKTINERVAVVERALELIDRAIAQDKYDLADQIVKVVLAPARKSRNNALMKQLASRRKEVSALVKKFAEVKIALTQLEKDPTNQKSNLTVGKHRCFTKGDWAKGLTMLALGSDKDLKAVALADLQKPSTSSGQYKLGNVWWVLSEKAQGITKTQKNQMQWRAGYWYRKAMPGLTGLGKTITRKRLEVIAEIKPAGTQKTTALATKPIVIFDGESRLVGWQIVGKAFGLGIGNGRENTTYPAKGFNGRGLISSYHVGDSATGMMISPKFRIRAPRITFLIGGGSDGKKVSINLLVDGKPVRTATGPTSNTLRPHEWDVSDLVNKTAQIVIVDKHTGGWGHILIDDIILQPANASNQQRAGHPIRQR